MSYSFNNITEMVLAVDIGTSGCRAALFNSSGDVVNSAEQHYTYSYVTETGYAEQDPDHILFAFIDVLKRAGNGYSDAISSVVVDSVLHSLVLLEETGVPLTPITIWADTRATEQCHLIQDVFNQRSWHKKTGCPLSPSYPLARLLWYRDHRPELFGRIFKVLTIKSYILFKLFGHFLEDESLASASGMCNLRDRCWNGEIIEYIGLNLRQLPKIVPVEYLLPVTSAEFHFLPELKAVWIIGGGDGPMAHIGSAGYARDHLSITIGTSSAARMITSVEEAGHLTNSWTYLLDRSHCITGLASNNGGNVLDWYCRKFLKTGIDWYIIDGLLAASSFSETLLFFPFLFSERNISASAGTGSGFLGVRPEHAETDFIRAIIEGILFHAVRMLKQLVDGRPLSVVALSGSLTKLDFVQKTASALLEIPVKSASDTHAPQLGSFFLVTGKQPHTDPSFVCKHNAEWYLAKWLLWNGTIERGLTTSLE